MNLARHAAVLWRFKLVTAGGLLLGVFLAVFASYKISPSGLEVRGESTYASQSQLLVTQAGFPEGRVVLPSSPAGGTTEEPKIDPNRLEFADPNRFMALADLYTKLIASDEVRGRLPRKVKDTQIVASPLPAVSGAPILPIIQLDTTAGTAAGAQQLNTDVGDALRELLNERQKKAGISPAQSIQIQTLKKPSEGALSAGPSHTSSILALLLVIIGTIAITHLLASLRPRHTDVPALDELELEWAASDPTHANGNGHGAGKPASRPRGGVPTPPPTPTSASTWDMPGRRDRT